MFMRKTCVYLSEPQYQAIKVLAEREGISLAEMLRRLLAQALTLLKVG